MIEWQTDPLEKTMNWHKAMKYAESLGDGWRLPTRAELVDAYDNNVKDFKKIYYWSSSAHAKNTNAAWHFVFDSGDVDVTDKTSNLYVRCVREDKEERWKPYELGVPIASIFPNLHNSFRTKELAELRAKQFGAENELFNIWEHLVGDWRPDWSDNKNLKYCVEYHRGNIKINANISVSDRSLYRFFPTEELARRQYELASTHARAYIRGEF